MQLKVAFLILGLFIISFSQANSQDTKSDKKQNYDFDLGV